MSGKRHIIEFAPSVFAVVLGVCAIFATGAGRTEFVDSSDYLAHAKVIVETGQYPSAGILPIFRPPLYPLFIAAVWSVFPGSILVIKLLQVLLLGLTAWLIFRIAMLVTENRFLSLLGAVFFAANPIILYVAVAIQSEMIHIFLITLASFFAVRMLMTDERGLATAGMLGAVLGLAALGKPSALGVGAVMAGVLFLLRFRQKGSFIASATVMATMFLAVLPWSLYLLKTKGEFILVSNGGGYNLWIGNLPATLVLYEGAFGNTADEFAASDDLSMNVSRQQIAEWESTVGYSQLSLKQQEKLWQTKAIENMSANPAVALKLFGWKLYNYWKPYVSSNIHSAKASVLSGVFLLTFFIFGAWGVVKVSMEPKTRKVVWLFAAMAASATLIHVALVSSMRLRLPYVDPFLAIFAAISFGGLLVKLLGKSAWLDWLKKFEIREFAAT